jgi:hypothetical protein
MAFVLLFFRVKGKKQHKKYNNESIDYSIVWFVKLPGLYVYWKNAVITMFRFLLAFRIFTSHFLTRSLVMRTIVFVAKRLCCLCCVVPSSRKLRLIIYPHPRVCLCFADLQTLLCGFECVCSKQIQKNTFRFSIEMGTRGATLTLHADIFPITQTIDC